MSANRPLLLLDVDGTLSPIPRQPGRTYPHGVEWKEVARLAGEILVDARLPAWLEKLSASYDFLWATSWHEQANEILSAPLGLPTDLPWIDFTAHHRNAERAEREVGCGKFGAVRAALHSARRPAAWVDDDLSLAAIRWAHQRRIPTLFLPTTPNVGITERHVERLERWAAELGAGIGDARSDAQ